MVVEIHNYGHETILEDPRFKHFLNSRQLKEQTILRYTRELTLYKEFTGMTLTDLIAEAREDQEKQPLMDDRRLSEHLFNHISFMEVRDYSHDVIPHRNYQDNMGHKIDDVTQSYLELDVGNVREGYKKAIPSLTFLEEALIIERGVDITQHPKFIKMHDKLNVLEKQRQLPELK